MEWTIVAQNGQLREHFPWSPLALSESGEYLIDTKDILAESIENLISACNWAIHTQWERF